MSSDKFKKVIKIAVVLYVASFLIINWNDVSWIFNYKEVYGLINDFFDPYPSIDASSIDAYFYPNRSQNTGTNVPQEVRSAVTTYTAKQNTIEVPKLSLEAPIIFSKSTDIKALDKDLESGAAYYPGSVYPGQKGQIIVLGHSAPPGWPRTKYNWIFSDLEKLSDGDAIFIHINNKRYAYIVKRKTIIQKGAEVPSGGFSPDSNILTLISCWPPGKDYQRIAVSAELITN